MLSIVIANFNEYKNLKKCLYFLNKQKNIKFEVIISEGKKDFKKIKKEYKFKLYQYYNKYPQNQEARKFLGYKRSRYKIICFLDSDNFITEKKFLINHLDTFKFSKVGFAYCKYYKYIKKDNYLNKYFSLIGVNDPIAWYIKKNDRYEYMSDKKFSDTLTFQNNKFSILNFKSIKTTIGANGFFIRKKILDKFNIKKPEDFLHIDTNIEAILKSDYRHYALVNASLWHHTADNLFSNLRKRSLYFNNFYFPKLKKRTYKMFDLYKYSDILKLLMMFFSNISLLLPLALSIKNFAKTKKREWLIHPFIMNIFIINYTITYLLTIVKNKIK